MRRKTKLVFSAISILILISASVIIAVLSFDEEDSRALLGWAIKHFSGYTVTIQGPLSVDLSMTPSLRASKILIEPPEGASSMKISRIERIHARVALVPLLIGKIHILNLGVDGATVSWDPWKKAPESAKKKYEAPDVATLRNITLIIPPHGHMSALNIFASNLQLEHVRKTDSLLIKGAGTINNSPIRINGLFGMFAASSNPAKTYPVDFNLQIADLDMKIKGTIDDPKQWEGMHLNVDMKELEVATLLHMLGIHSGPMGQMHVQAKLGGGIEAPGISDISIAITESPLLSLTATGAIPDLKSGDGAFLKVSGACTDKALLHVLSPKEFMITAIDFKGNLHGTRQGLNVENVQASAVTDRHARVQAQGKIHVGSWPYPVSAWVFSLKGELVSPTISALLTTREQSVPEMGPVRAKFHIMGTSGRFALEDIDVSFGNKQSLTMNWSGRIGKVEPGGVTPFSSVNLIGSLTAGTIAYLNPFVKGTLPDLGPLWARCNLIDRNGGYALENMQIILGKADAFRVEATGAVDTGMREKKISLDRIALRCRVSGAEPRQMEKLFGLDKPYLDSLEGSFDLSGSPQDLSVSKAHVSASIAQEMKATLDGSIRRVNLMAMRSIKEKGRKGMDGKDAAIEGVDLHFTAKASGTHKLMQQVGFQKPYIESFEGSFDLTGSPDNFSITKVLVEAGMMGKANISLSGSIDHLDVKDHPVVKGVDLNLKGSAPDSGILSKLTGRDFQELGAISFNAHLGDKEGALEVNPFEVHTGKTSEEALIITGYMHDVLNAERFFLDAAFVTSSKVVFENSLQEPGKQSFPISGKIKIEGDTDQVHIQELQVTSPGADALFIDVKGSITDMSTSPTFTGTLLFDILDLSLITPGAGASLTSLGALNADGRIMIKQNNMSFNGTMNLGRTRFMADMFASSVEKRPRIIAKIHAPTIYLNDRNASPKTPSTSQAPVRPPVKPAGKRIFDTIPLHIDIPQTIDASISITADTVQDLRSMYSFHDVRLDASLEKGGLQLSPITFGYAGGSVTMDISIESHGKTPDMKMWLTTEDMDIATLEDYLHKPHLLDGKLSVSAYMHGQGNSAHEIASALEGDIGFAIENGTINRNVELLGADGVDMALSFTESITGDALDLVLPSAKKDKFTILNCMVARFTFQNGVGLSRIIAYDTSDYKVSGLGTLNLNKETMELVINPKSKKKLYDWSSSPIYISGPITNPSLRKIPLREAASLSGEIFAPYVFLPVRGLGYLWYLVKKDTGKDSSCAQLDLGDR